jgi:glycosyltransferase involved in cell wall biosynthesis
MRILTFTNLYPSTAQPRHGIFIEHRVRQLVASGEVSVRVIAPQPWVPAAGRLFGRYSALARVPATEIRDGVRVWYPRFFAVPKLTSWINPLLMALSVLPLARRLQRESDFDLIDAHFFYPDGAAAVLLGLWLGKPVAVTARGTDINIFPDYAVPRRWIRWVARRASALITVSASLRDALMRLGVARERVSVLRNGVDLELFTPVDRDTARDELRLDGPVMISVGHLIPDKGHQFVIEALPQLPGTSLLIAGDGPMRAQLEALAVRLGVVERIRWLGTLSQQQLARHYAAADITLLVSKIEGMPNVLLESLACGTPVVATNVGGNGEIVNARVAGMLIDERSAAAVAGAVGKLLQAKHDRSAVRRHAEQFGWAPTTQGLLNLFAGLAGRGTAASDAARASARAAG